MIIRQATSQDILGMQNANLHNLPENYAVKYYLYHVVTWPELSYVAVEGDKVVGYILGKMNDDDSAKDLPPNGHVTSISVLRPYRRLGLAFKLMRLSQVAMKENFAAEYVSLHVRKSNRAALSLYRDTLGFEVVTIEKKYYGDGEDAYSMKLVL